MASLEQDLGAPDTETRATLRDMIQTSLPGCQPASARFLAETARIQWIASGEFVFRQGEEVPLALLLSGLAVFRRTTVDGQQLTVGVAYPHEVFGITSISSTISSVDMIAVSQSHVATWHDRELRRVTKEDPNLALDIIDRLAMFLNILTEKLDGFLHQDARRRVMRVLARHRDLFFGDPAVLSRAHLPGLVGTSREMTGRVLRELEREGAIARVGRDGLSLLRPEMLDAIREPLDRSKRRPN